VGSNTVPSDQVDVTVSRMVIMRVARVTRFVAIGASSVARVVRSVAGAASSVTRMTRWA
jgi:hypothetical protein